MLRIAHSLRELPFPALMAVYREENQILGKRRWPWETPQRQLALAEEDFRDYLQSIFFPQEGALYALWEQDGMLLSALRLEPYRDGLLLEALATAPRERRKGYASALIQAVSQGLSSRGRVRLYAHVARNNTASLRTHARCGFRKIRDSAVYIDGSADSRCVTLLLDLPSSAPRF